MGTTPSILSGKECGGRERDVSLLPPPLFIFTHSHLTHRAQPPSPIMEPTTTPPSLNASTDASSTLRSCREANDKSGGFSPTTQASTRLCAQETQERAQKSRERAQIQSSNAPSSP